MKKEQIFFADFETATVNTMYYQKHKDTCILLWVVKNYFGSNEKLGTNMKTFFDYFKELKNKKSFCYFHNLNWDGDFILKWLDKHNFQAMNKKDFEKSKKPNTFYFFRQSRQIYKIGVCILNRNNKPIQIIFLCSYKILSSGVESLGKAIGLAKHDSESLKADFYDKEPSNALSDYGERFVEYAKNDVEIVRQSFINFQDNLNSIINKHWFLSNINLEKHFTIGSIAYNLQKQWVKNYSINKSEIFENFKIDYDTYQLASKFYFGGLTQFNPNFQNEVLECPNGYGFDVNSMYPSVMVEKLPYGPLKCFKTDNPSGDYLEYWEIDIDSAISKKGNFLCLINWNKINGVKGASLNRYVNSMYNFKCFYLKEEFELLKLFYKFDGVKIVNRWFADADSYLKDYVNELYELKSHYSKLKQPANALTYKIALNSSYGKHATRDEFKEIFVCKNESEKKELLQLLELVLDNKHFKVSEISSVANLENQHLIQIENIDIKSGNKYYNKLCAATITSYARMKLYKAVYDTGCENFIYCDTDSIYIKDAKHMDRLQIDDYKLGYWGIQNQFKYFIVKGAKAYTYSNDAEFKKDVKGTHSGLNRNWLAKNYDMSLFTENEQLIKLSSLKLENCKSGLVLVWKDYQSKKRLN